MSTQNHEIMLEWLSQNWWSLWDWFKVFYLQTPWTPTPAIWACGMQPRSWMTLLTSCVCEQQLQVEDSGTPTKLVIWVFRMEIDCHRDPIRWKQRLYDNFPHGLASQGRWRAAPLKFVLIKIIKYYYSLTSCFYMTHLLRAARAPWTVTEFFTKDACQC